ncbi:MAG: DUF4163 domain-containing protein [Bacteroidaceae bacterium]|nr:DUF4163 domain-containing protein [Bacteroidaceae bacterium]
MKKLLLLCTLPAMLIACGNQKNPNSELVSYFADSSDELSIVGTAEWADSVEIGPEQMATVKWRADVPIEGNQTFTDSVRRWVAMQMGDSLTVPADLQAYFDAEGPKALENDKEELVECTGGDRAWPMQYARDMTVSVLYEDDDYVTLQCQYYFYMGGAHGSTTNEFATFRRTDGHIMGWELLATMPDIQLRHTIKQGLKGYFEATTDEELYENLLLLSDDENIDLFSDEFFPLPITPPFLTDRGVEVLYQQYEITAYAYGMPTCVVLPRK